MPIRGYYASIIKIKKLTAYLQDVFSTTIEKIEGFWYFRDGSGKGNKVKIANITCGYMNGTVYVQCADLTGITITSYEGDSVPSINGNRIEFTSGLIFSVTRSDGKKATFNEEDEDEIHFTDGNGNVEIATLESVVLANFWTKSDQATPGNTILGESAYLTCQGAGTTAHPADPKKGNLGVELITDGNFESDLSGFALAQDGVNNIVVIVDDKCKLISDGGTCYIWKKNIYESTKLYRVTLDIEVISGTVYICPFSPLDANNRWYISESGQYTFIIDKPSSTGLFISRSAACEVYISNWHSQEVQAIPAYGTYLGTINKTSSSGDAVVDIIKPDVDSINGIQIVWSSAGRFRFRINGGDLFTTISGYLTLGETYTFKVVFIEVDNSFTVKIKGGSLGDQFILPPLQAGSNPVINSTYTTSKFKQINGVVGDTFSHLSKDGERFPPEDFSDGSGTYAVQRVPAADENTDCKGNALEIPAGAICNNDQTYQGIKHDDMENRPVGYKELIAVESDGTTEVLKTDYYLANLKKTE